MEQKKVAKMSIHKPSARMIAEAAGAKESTVYSVLTGRRVKGKKAKQITVAEQMLGEGMDKLVEEVKKAVII